MNNYLKTLELDKILNMLSSFASNDETRRMAKELRPCSDLAVVLQENTKTNQALELSIQYGTPPFSSFKDVSVSAKRAKTGAVISQFGSQGMSLAFCHAVQYFPETGTMIHLAGVGQFV